MKNTFKFELGNVSFTIDETPFNIEGINITADLDANVHELAQLMASYKTIFREVKDMIKNVNDPISINCECTHGCCDDASESKVEPKVEPEKENIVDVWRPLEKRLVAAGFKKTCYGNYQYIADNKDDYEIGSRENNIHIELENGCIKCFVHIDGKDIAIFRHEGRKSTCDSLPRECFDEFLDESDLPRNVKDIVIHVLDM